MNTDTRATLDQLRDAAANLRDALNELGTLTHAAVRAKIEAENAWDEAYLTAEGTEQHRKSFANVKTKDLRTVAAGAKASEDLCKQQIRSFQSLLNGWQSIASAQREEAKFARTGGDNYQ